MGTFCIGRMDTFCRLDGHFFVGRMGTFVSSMGTVCRSDVHFYVGRMGTSINLNCFYKSSTYFVLVQG